MKKLVQQVKKLAAVRTPVLLVGENGTGKATVAEILHGATGAEPGAAGPDRLLAQLRAELPRGPPRQNGEGGPWVREAKGGTLFLQHLQCLALPCRRSS
jgi:two-component system, NtrC family, response regulator HydG